MRRIALIALLVVGLPVLLAVTLGADNGGGGSGYQVRAIFDTAANVVKGEDLRISGAKVGKVKSIGVTPQNKAAVVVQVDNGGFTPFHADATCTIRPASLIGEKYVECKPGTVHTPVLAKIPKGQDGSGQHLLPLTRTSSPVDIDLVGDISRLPIRQRFAILINEFGTALAGRGQQLNNAIHRANPALRDTDRVLAILADQNRTLANLAKESDQALAPLAARRQQVADFIVKANQTGEATAERSADIQRTFQRFPPFLQQLDPTLVDLGNVAQQTTPVLTDLRAAAPDLNRFVTQLGPFSKAATPAVKTLGQATVVGRPALVQSEPLITLLAKTASDANPVARMLDELTASLDKSGGVEELMNWIFFQSIAVNGFDGVSHYLRAGLITNLCSSYATQPVPGCSANFRETKSISASSAGVDDPSLVKLREALRKANVTTAEGKPIPAASPLAGLQELTDPSVAAKRNAGLANIRRTAQGGRAGTPAAGITGPSAGQTAAMNYLLGSDGG
jgi:ABC-type transporter Mla subunit MlaD